jgi:hypothetical protein
MAGDRWTFLVVQDESSPVRQYSLSSRALRALVVAGSLFTLAVLGFGFASGFEGLTRLEARHLRERNRALQVELTRFNDRIRSLEDVLDQMAANDANFRSIAGLEVIDPEVLQAGVGGPGLGSLETSPLWSVDSETAQVAFASSYDLSALERRARLLSERRPTPCSRTGTSSSRRRRSCPRPAGSAAGSLRPGCTRSTTGHCPTRAWTSQLRRTPPSSRPPRAVWSARAGRLATG